MVALPNPHDPRGPQPAPAKPPLAPRLVAIVASAVLWLAACAMPALYVQYTDNHETEALYGAWCAIFGPLGAFYGCFAWYANVTALVAALLLGLRRYVGATVLSAISVVLALTMAVLFKVDLDMDEGGVRHARVVSLGFACAPWLASLALLGAVALWRLAREAPRESR